MLGSILKAYRELGMTQLRGRWRDRKSACPLYVLAMYWSKQQRHDKVMNYIDRKWGRPYRNGFTNAIDGLEYDPSCESTDVRGFYTKGYDDGEYIRRKLFPESSEGLRTNRFEASSKVRS